MTHAFRIVGVMIPSMLVPNYSCTYTVQTTVVHIQSKNKNRKCNKDVLSAITVANDIVKISKPNEIKCGVQYVLPTLLFILQTFELHSNVNINGPL